VDPPIAFTGTNPQKKTDEEFEKLIERDKT
jgi:hypothetical protein